MIKTIFKLIDECKPLTNGKANPYFLQDHVGPLDDFINKNDIKDKLIKHFKKQNYPINYER